MIFLNEKITAVLFGGVCFLTSMITGISRGTLLQVVMVRALIFSIIALGVGYIFGIVIKGLFLETILKEQGKEHERIRISEEKKRREEERIMNEHLRGHTPPSEKS